MKTSISDLTWQEVEKLAKDKNLIVVPIGSTEQHGPHLPIATDSVIAYEIAKKACEKLAVPLAPLISISCSAEHRGFPGTISLFPATFKKILVDICASLAHHGFHTIILFNAHGGNSHALQAIVPKLRRKIHARIFSCDIFDLYRKRRGIQIHADEFETSLLLYLKPNLVKMSRTVNEYPQIFRKQLATLVKSKISWRKYTKSGVVGNPTRASRAHGREIFEEIFKNLKIFLEKFVEPALS